MNKEIQLVINIPIGNEEYDDSYIRKAAIKYKFPILQLCRQL